MEEKQMEKSRGIPPPQPPRREKPRNVKDPSPCDFVHKPLALGFFPLFQSDVKTHLEANPLITNILPSLQWRHNAETDGPRRSTPPTSFHLYGVR